MFFQWAKVRPRCVASLMLVVVLGVFAGTAQATSQRPQMQLSMRMESPPQASPLGAIRPAIGSDFSGLARFSGPGDLAGTRPTGLLVTMQGGDYKYR